MRKKNKINGYNFLLLLLTSCGGNSICTITPIDKKIADTTILKDDLFIQNLSLVEDTLIVSNYFNDINNVKKNTILNKQECGHYISLDYNFKNEVFGISLVKKNDNNYILSIYNKCTTKDIILNDKQILNDSIIKIQFEHCDDISIKEIGINKIYVKYIKSKNETYYVKPADRSVLIKN